jgi:hypothetical protein
MRTILAAALAVALAGPAFAGRCPTEMAAIDAALQTAQLSEADMARVRELRAQGEELHNAGDHAGSEAALDEAKAILGI